MNNTNVENNFVAYQEFYPKEKDETDLCIWCMKKFNKNKAHVFFEKLLAI